LHYVIKESDPESLSERAPGVAGIHFTPKIKPREIAQQDDFTNPQKVNNSLDSIQSYYCLKKFEICTFV